MVLTALSIPGHIQQEEGVYCLYVPVEQFAIAQREIGAYLDENPETPPPPPPEPGQPAIAAAILFAAILWLCAWVFEWVALDIYTLGRVDAFAVAHGEVGRLVTALFLHADLGHILANSVFGGAAAYFVARTIGSAASLSAAVLLGALGNALNVISRFGAQHLSIGASTSVFALLGVLGVFGWLARTQPQYRWLTRLSPLLAAIALLGFTGTGGERTDLGAHFWGFIAGAIAGWPLYRFRSTLARPPGAWWIAGVAVFTTGAAWISQCM